MTLTASQMLYSACHSLPDLIGPGTCYLCGGKAYAPVSQRDVLKITFTGFDTARASPDMEICFPCAWSLQEENPDLMQRITTTPRMRLYSHFVIGGQWLVFTKAHKVQMTALLLQDVFPEVVVIAESGQKHLIYRARANPVGQSAGWVQFEERSVWLERSTFASLYTCVQEMYDAGFSKTAILTGQGMFYPDELRLAIYEKHYETISQARGTQLFELVVYLVTKSDREDQDGK